MPNRKTFQPVRLPLRWFPVLLQLLFQLLLLPKNAARPRSEYLGAGLLLILTPLSWTRFIPPSFRSVLKSKKTGATWGHLTPLHPSVPYLRFLFLRSTKPLRTLFQLCPRQVPQFPSARVAPVPSTTLIYPDSTSKQQPIPQPRELQNLLKTGLCHPYKGNQSWWRDILTQSHLCHQYTWRRLRLTALGLLHLCVPMWRQV